MKKKAFGVRQQVESPIEVEKFLDELCKRPPKTRDELEKKKRNFSARTGIPPILNRDLIAVIGDKELPEDLEKLFKKRAVRTVSGVSPIGILTKAYPCPGKCVYCPLEDRMPKSYLSSQPAAARALRNKFHPFRQVESRITALKDSGHPTSKLEVIVMGGTWSFLPKKYQSWYVKRVFDAANQTNSQTSNFKLQTSKNLTEAQQINEIAEHRIIGLTLETRPDFITEEELVRMRKLGCTRIEIGVQTLDDEVQKLTKRGHLKKDVARAMQLMRDFGFKICWHLMPGLPGSNPQKDLKWMKEVFSSSDARPDFIKIYPCQVLANSELENWWRKGDFQPMLDKELVKLLLQFKTFVPPWTRIMRLMRDIPISDVLDGVKFSNLRQIMKDQPKKLKELLGKDFFVDDWVCKCIRCREIGFAVNKNLGVPVLKRRDYEASGGQEVFLSFETEDEKQLFALLRLRKPSKQKYSSFRSVLQDTALIREVHSYGTEISVGKEAGIGQHRGLGKKLLLEAERIAKEEWGLKKMTIIAGVGTREYYRKFGYELKSTYMVKKLR